MSSSSWARGLRRAALVLATAGIVGGTAVAILLGCGGPETVATPVPGGMTEVQLAQGGGYGKAVFIVNPHYDRRRNEDCYVSVPTSEGDKKVACKTAYVVGCDIDIPTDKPFCVLVREIGVDRESAYPKHKRQ
jgi:hypothetical protein